ncbi:MAG: Hsp70 family protein, partial [Gammaproteobacteria bacterium]
AMAGLSGSTLLEEPQAAFYAWIHGAGGKWRDQVKMGDLILVTDVGGGTTDLSLIQVSEEEGELALERVAVGKHLLVGGDNMDLTLAYFIANRMASSGQKLDAHQMRGLCHGCRTAKEHLFEKEGPESFPITILSRGSRLIGGSIKTELVRNEMEDVLTKGFFPPCDSAVQPKEQVRTGVRELGLSYASDPAITHHLAHFLGRQGSDAGPACPTAVLFNGGVMKAKGLRRRVLNVLGSWAEEAGRKPPREIGIDDFDLAVARGAACYGLARRGRGIRIRGGLSRSYYIGMEASFPAVPGMPTPVKALCVAPFGMEEGTDASLAEREFGLVVGEPVRFDFLGSTSRQNDRIGTVVEDWEGDIEKITTVETVLEGVAGTVLPVTMDIRVTEVGTLELWCVSTETDHKYRLEFNVRERAEE